jgi:chemotaxis regulatin CheY-phosphate phosphatase CheZ
MSDDAHALATMPASDYDAIEQAVMETARGRWFLREFAARNRNADTTVLLNAIAKLETAVTGERASEQIEHVRFDLMEMAKSITRLKSEIDATTQGGQEVSHFGEATSALDDIVRTTERATSGILESAEAIQEVAWSLRENQVDEQVCERIDKLATDIYTACAFQDLTAQRTQKVVRTLRFLEGRINALMDEWQQPPGRSGVAPPTRPASSDSAADLSQSDVDIVIVDKDWHGMASEDALEVPSAAADEHAIAMQIADIEQRAEAELDGLMVADIEVIEVDDGAPDEVAFMLVDTDQPSRESGKPATSLATSHPSSPSSLAEIDALPTAAKAQIFG